MGVLKLPKLGLSRLWGPITLCANLQLKWSLRQSCSPCWKLFNGMSHATCMQGNQVDSWLLMVGSQIANLTPSPSFGHNLCFKCPNGSCEASLDMYIPRNFQWYKEIFSPMGFDLCDRSLKIRESIETPTLKMGIRLGVGMFILSHSITFSTSQEHGTWLPGFILSLHPCKPLPWSRAQG
jgi:hypothetical protein